MTITYTQGDATRPQGVGPKIIVHVCNDKGGWGAGFVLAVSKRWRAPEKAYREWYSTSNGSFGQFGLGGVQLVEVEPNLWVANMVAQEGYARPGRIPLRYDALKECLIKVAGEAKTRGASIHMPRIGCGLAGGKWSEVEPLIVECLGDLSATVYDFKI